MDRMRIKLLIGAVVVVSAFTYLFLTGMRASQVYYLTVSEYRGRADTIPAGEHFRISGRVSPGTVRRSDDGLSVQFAVYEPGKEQATLPVLYRGIIPDTFMENSEVVVEGAMRSETFEAHTLLAKCPSKYEGLGDKHPAGAGGVASASAPARP
jgi:cytochrome c-type biogenesis protein CcmE